MTDRAWIVAIVFACGCTKHMSAHVTQPPLLMSAGLVARTSLPLEIVMRDMEYGPVRTRNSAYFVVVSRDRLRFHIALQHKWDDVADLRTWNAYVVDGRGRRLEVDSVSARVRPIDRFFVRGALYRTRQPIYDGAGTLSVYEHDLIDADGSITLVLSRPGFEYRFHWITTDVDPEG
ncbi:MAG TPA: hypothetical protein VGO00_01635 [Kofleriaceae bacterium]|nr:hypothetical protein [Kofleriaceae bacterium]